jgi:hypothetical protein
MTCKAIQYSDQMNCAACGLVWDMNDPEPPACKPESERNAPTNGKPAKGKR